MEFLMLTAYLLGLATLPALALAVWLVGEIDRLISGPVMIVIGIGRLGISRGGQGFRSVRFQTAGFVRNEVSISIGTRRARLLWLTSPRTAGEGLFTFKRPGLQSRSAVQS